MVDDGVVREEDADDSEAFPVLTGYALGYKTAIDDFWKLLMKLGIHYHPEVYGHCYTHIEQLIEWYKHGQDQPPPTILPYRDDAE